MKILRPLLLGSALTAGALLAQTDAPVAKTSLATGFDYSRGSYGLASDTTVTSVPVELTYDSGPWIFRAFTSWLTIKGPSAAALTGGSGNLTRPTASSESGLGDLYADATYRADPFANGVRVDTTLRAKIPTADEARGLGTGEADYYGQLNVYRTFGATTPYVTGGYRVLGDSDRYQLRDGPYASAGAHFRASDQTVITVGYDWSSRITDAADSASDAMVAVTHDVNDRWRVFAYALKGFTDASPDVGAGLRVSYRF